MYGIIKAFNDFVKNLRPINGYCKANEKKWRRWEDREYSCYENEQHSAAVEFFNDVDDTNYHRCQLNQSEIEALREVYEALHY